MANDGVQSTALVRILYSPLVFLLLMANSAMGQGWGDYELRINSGHIIYRANSVDVGVMRPDSSVILHPQSYPGVGPIVRYSDTDRYLLTEHIGRKPRQLSPEDRLEESDWDRRYYFLIRKADDGVMGPFDRIGFDSSPEVRGLGSIRWKALNRPNVNALYAAMLATFVVLVFVVIAVRRRAAASRNAKGEE
jgi:hypothetical protein